MNRVPRFLTRFFTLSKTSDGQGDRRIRRAAFTGIITLAVRGITTAVSLISIPLTAQYLGTERFGVWLTLSMLLSWVSLTDFGVANSLTNALSSADGQKDRQQAQQAVSTAFWLTVGCAIVLALAFAFLYPWVEWNRVFNVVSDQAKSEIGWATIAFFVGFVLRLPLSIAGRIYTAYQEGYFYQAWNGLSSVLAISTLLAAIHFQAGLPQLVILFFGTSLLGDLLSTLHVFGWKWRSLRPDFAAFDWSQAQWLLKTGLQFWVVQTSAIIFFQTDLLIVTQLFGAKEVAVYGITLKLFTLLGTIHTAFLFPLWPAYSEAFSRGDIFWVIQTFRRTIVFTLIWSILSSAILAIFTNKIINAWLNQAIFIDEGLILAMATTNILLALSHCIGTLLNGLGKLKSQVIFGLAAGMTNLFLSVFLGHLIGVSGICWATAICLLVFSIGIIGTQTLKTLQKMHFESKLINSRQEIL
jgi:O-antigen/teichoic acid export membrane protein